MAVGPYIRVSGLLLSMAGVFASLSGAYATEPVPRLSKAKCAGFFDPILKDTDEDLALVPYLYHRLNDTFAVMNAPGLTKEKRIENLIASDVEFIRQPEYASLITPKVEAMFRGRVTAAMDNLDRGLRRAEWYGGEGKVYREIFSVIEDSEPITKKSYLKKKTLKWMANEFEDIHAVLAGGEISSKNIELSAHEIRRRIRKIAQATMFYDGMFYLERELKVFDVTLDAAKKPSQFVPNETNLLKRAVPLSYDGFQYIGQIIKRLGKLKGNDGLKEFIHAALADAKLGADARPLLDAVNPSGAAAPSFQETRRAIDEIFKELVESEFLLQMAKQFRTAAREFE